MMSFWTTRGEKRKTGDAAAFTIKFVQLLIIFQVSFSFTQRVICWSPIGDFRQNFGRQIFFPLAMATKTVVAWGAAVLYGYTVALWWGKRNQVPCCDWLLERVRLCDLACCRLHAVSNKRKFLQFIGVLWWCVNRPFYSWLLSDLAFEWQWGWRWPCFDINLLFLCSYRVNAF